MRRLRFSISIAASFFATALSAQNPTLSALTTSFVAPIRSAATLGRWRITHPTDTILRSWEGHGYVQCASAHSHRAIVGGDTAEIRVLFYVPALPASRELPVHETPDQVLDRCQAGAVRITVFDSSARVTTLLRALQQNLATVHLFGDSVQPWMPSQFGSMDGLSRHDDSVVVASVRWMGGKQGDVTFSCCELTAHVAARRTHEDPELPGWNHQTAVDDSIAAQSTAQSDTLRLLALFHVAAIGGAVEREMRGTLTQLAHGDVAGHTMIDLFQRWLSALKPLPRARRAAALLIADSLMMSWEPFFADDSGGNNLRDRLVSAGVPISLVPDGKDGWCYSYQRDWAKETYQIAPTSLAGEYAFLYVIAPQGQCATHKAAVIARSEAYLRRYPHARMRGQLHAFLGEEWAAETMLNAVDQDEASNPANALRLQRWQATRQRAIAHFQAAFRLNVEPEKTWRDAFMVLAGLPSLDDDADCE